MSKSTRASEQENTFYRHVQVSDFITVSKRTRADEQENTFYGHVLVSKRTGYGVSEYTLVSKRTHYTDTPVKKLRLA